MIGFKVMTKQGLRGPFQKSSILKGIETGVVPLKAQLLDLHTNRMIIAADLVGVELDDAPSPARKKSPARPPAIIKPAKLPLKSRAAVKDSSGQAGKKKSGKVAAPANPPPQSFHDTTVISPVDGGLTLGRATAQGGAAPVNAAELSRLSDMSDLILTDDVAPPLRRKKK